MFGYVGEDIATDAAAEAQAQRAEMQQMVSTANDKAVAMSQTAQDAASAMKAMPMAIGGWGIVWLGGIYWFILRPLLK